MSTKVVTAVAIKFFAFWLLIYTVAQVPQIVLSVNTLHSYSQEEVSITNYSLLILFAVFFGFFASYLLFKVSNSILSSMPDDTASEKNNVSQGFLLQLGGAYFVVSAISSLINISYIYLQEHVETSSYLVLASTIFRLVIGISMLVSSSTWVYLFNKLRGRV